MLLCIHKLYDASDLLRRATPHRDVCKLLNSAHSSLSALPCMQKHGNLSASLHLDHLNRFEAPTLIIAAQLGLVYTCDSP